MYTVAAETCPDNDRPVFTTRNSQEKICTHCQARVHKTTPIHGTGLYYKFQLDAKRRYLWGLNMTAALVGAIYFSWAMMMEYVRSNTATHITVIQNDSMLLPTVYACPRNADVFDYDVIFKDVELRLGYFNFNDTRDILVYFIAGCGFQNTDVSDWQPARLWRAQELFTKWRRKRSISDLFKFVFDDNGVTCRDVFRRCTLSGRDIDCCELFTTSYVMLRGKCMRLKPLMQYGSFEGDKLVLSLATPESRLIDGKLQKQFVFYLGDQYPEIAMYPRVYLTYDYLGRLQLKARKIEMLHRPSICNYNENYPGRYSCFVNSWLLENVIERFNCTLPYLMSARVSHGYQPCEPEIIVQHYDFLLNATLSKYKCILNCDRWDHYFKYRTVQNSVMEDPFSIEIYYPDLFYEVYNEIQMTSLPGFVSQVGGQIVLFLGTSIISVVYVLTSMINRLKMVGGRFWRHQIPSPTPARENDQNSTFTVDAVTFSRRNESSLEIPQIERIPKEAFTRTLRQAPKLRNLPQNRSV